jgi:uncharacterized protein with von Willebrand factor type A (vWA) domain
VERALAIAMRIGPEARTTFAELFELWWSAAAKPGHAESPGPRAVRERALDARRVPASQPSKVMLREGDERAADRTSASRIDGSSPGYSAEALLRRKPFDACTRGELLAMERLLARLALRLATRPSRRRVPTRGRGEPDLRRSLRRSLATGGELLSLAHRRRAVERPRLVALVDTSGSMDPHARFLLAFLLSLREVAPSSELFVFNTALVRLTPWLRPGGGAGHAAPSGASAREGASHFAGPAPAGTVVPDPVTSSRGREAPVAISAARVGAGRFAGIPTSERIRRILDHLAAGVPDWSGGTRIGECLATFVARHLATLVDRRTIVLILSDGLDRGDVAPLAGAMAAIRRRARRVLWLNPLAGDPRYEATARAMAAALPFVDRLLPVHDLESLARLLPHLAA